tara:strand:- start:859 stop:1920 length:1062 start_codon:yes stop_codon:yes gene_type:complete
MIFNYVLSSVTFLQLYIPLAKYAFEKHSIKSVFIKCDNLKDYANPYSKENKHIIKHAIKPFDYITLVDYNKSLLETKGIFFVVDGDIYGQRKQFVNHSKLKLINKKSLIISLQEHMNFVWAYDKFINNVNYCVFPNKHLADYYNKINDKNVYLGNTKFDNINLNKPEIYEKYNLNQNEKYCVFLYPRELFMKQLKISFEKTKNLIDTIEKHIGLKVIVKYRPKDTDGNDLSKYKCVISDCYPNQSIELMTICDLCVMFSSSCIDECIITNTPCIDCVIDYADNHKMAYLENPNVLQKIKHWEKKSPEEIKNVYNLLDKPDSGVFQEMRKEYLFELNESSEKIVNFTLKTFSQT